MVGKGMQKIVDVVKEITIEPLIVLYYISIGLMMPTDAALWYRKVCIHLYKDEYICDTINTNESLADMEEEVQSLNSEWNFYNTLCFCAPAMILTFFYGSWSDRISRKIPMLLPQLATILGSVIYMLSAVFQESPLGILLISNILNGLTGGMLTMLMATMSYIADISTPENRTLRISITYAFNYLSSFIAYTVSGVLFDNTGFVFMYTLIIIISCMGIVYTIFGFKDIKRKEKSSDDKAATISQTEDKNLSVDKTKCKDFCNLKHAKDAVQTVFLYRKQNHRAHIFGVLAIVFLYGMSYASAIQYLYLKHPPLSFSQTLYGYYDGYSLLLKFTCMAFFIPFLKKVWQFGDVPLLLTATMFQMGANILMAFSVHTWMVFLVPVVGYMASGAYTFMRGILSSMVKVDELGKIFAFIAVLENLGSIVASGLYSYFLYPLTIDIFAGFCYICGAVLLLLPLGICIWLYIDLRKVQPYENLYEDYDVPEGQVQFTRADSVESSASQDITVSTLGGERY